MNDELNATPSAIALAKELGVDIDNVEGSGIDGRIVKSDVEARVLPQLGTKEPILGESTDLHTVVRVISKTGAMNPNASAFPIVQVDAYVASFLEQGYELVDTHYLGEIPEGFIMMYILLRQ